MRRLTYSPKVYAFVRTDKHARPLNISNFIVRGNVHRRTDAVSTAEIEIRNPDKVFTQIGDPVFRPMDPITIFMTRLANRPVQVFTGYLDTTPYLQLFPGTVTLTASCTLKRLLHTYWDPSLPYVFNGFLREYGWNVDPKTGQMFSDNLYDGPKLDRTGRSLNDGSFGALLYATMEHVGQWDTSSIYIEKLPDGTNGSADIIEKVTEMYASITAANEKIQDQAQTLLKNLVGTGSAGAGGGPLGALPEPNAPKGSYTIAELVRLAESVGLRGESAAIAAAIAMAESTGNPETVNGIGCVGLWQIYQSVHPELGMSVEDLKNPQKNAEAMKRISSNGTDWTPWTTFTGADTPGHEKTYLRHLAAARAALSPLGQETTSSQWTAQTETRASTSTSSASRGAAPDSTDASDPSKPRTTRWDAILAEANRITHQKKMYTFGGGHSDPVPKDGPWDCSSAISGLLQAAGYDVPTFATPSAPSILTPGQGKKITFWNNASPGASGHIYAVINGRRWGAESGQNSGWLAGDPTKNGGYTPFTVPGGEDTLDEPADVPTGADTSVPGGGGDPGTTGVVPDNSSASAFAAYLNLPNALDTGEALLLQGKKSLLNDQPLFPFVQQLCQGSLRNFQSMPNGNFFGFFPDYFGGFGHRTPYWLIDDIEILDGGIDISDDYLATHVYIIGDTNLDGQVDFLDELQSGGVMDIESALGSDFLQLPDSSESGGLGLTGKLSHKDVVTFLQRYGARPYKEEMPMIRSPYFEAFMAYQRFMQLWAQQFATKFQFTFMPELYPGGIVGLVDHGIQCYIEEVVHSFDYESGFTTDAVLSSPAAMKNSETNVSAGMVRGFDLDSTDTSKKWLAVRDQAGKSVRDSTDRR
jgi:hypothetical protein